MKTEKQKMLSGQLYNATDKTLVKERHYCRHQLSIYNSCPAQTDVNDILKKLLGKIGSSFHIEPNFYCDYGYNIHLGKNFYANFNCTFLDVNTIKIGNNCFVGPNVQIYTAGHPVNPDTRLTGLEFGLPVEIGDNVWIGGAAIICPGIKIGNNVTIAAGSVVTKDIPSNVLVGENPARILKENLNDIKDEKYN